MTRAKMSWILAFGISLAVLSVSADPQVQEAAAVFSGVKPATVRGGNWKVVYASAEGPEGRALEVLTQYLGPVLLREGHTSTSLVLPLEDVGGVPVEDKRDAILIGTPETHPGIGRYLKPGDVPHGGYRIKTFREASANRIVIAGCGPQEVLWGTFDFLDTIVPELEKKLAEQSNRYRGTLFRAERIPEGDWQSAPETPVRSVFSWGHVIDDYRETFRSMARARFNRAILWNDQRVVNAKEVVACAHDWGLEVFWGFSWGWTLSGKDGPVDFDALADEVVLEWRTKWRTMGGDGIYFQSFTETDKKTIDGRPIPEAVVAFANAVARRILTEAPSLRIVFGLHANSMRTPGAAEALAHLDSSFEILWENCGGFPYWEYEEKPGEPDVAFTDRVLALTPLVGLAWKDQLRIDWNHFAPPAGPFLLGTAGPDVLMRDRSVITPQLASYDEDWIVHGRSAYELARHVRAGAHPPREFNAVAEYNPPFAYATHLQAEIFWNTSDGWEIVERRARARTRAANGK